MANSQLILFWKWINLTSNSPILLWLHLPISWHMSSPGEMWSSRSSTWPIAGRENTISITLHISKHFSLSPSVFSYPLPGGETVKARLKCWFFRFHRIPPQQHQHARWPSFTMTSTSDFCSGLPLILYSREDTTRWSVVSLLLLFLGVSSFICYLPYY